MMIIVQSFAASQDCENPDVRGRVIEISVAYRVAEAIDGRREHEHIHYRMDTRRKQSPTETQDGAERDGPESNAKPAVAEDIAVPPALFDVFGIAADHIRFFDLTDVAEDVSQLYLPEALDLGTVRIALFISKHMMLAVNSDPLLGCQAGGDP